MAAAKTYSKGAKRRAKRDALPELAETPRKQPNGRKRRQKGEVSDRNAERTVLEARARQLGKFPEDMGEMRTPALGEAAGRAIYTIHEGEAAGRLWQAYSGLTAAEAQYAKRYLGLRLHAKTAKIEMTPEAFETRADDRPDLRSEEERDREAINNWMRWRGMVMHLAARDQKVIFDVAYGRVEPMDAGKPTATGRHFVEAMGKLADVLERRH